MRDFGENEIPKNVSFLKLTISIPPNSSTVDIWNKINKLCNRYPYQPVAAI